MQTQKSVEEMRAKDNFQPRTCCWESVCNCTLYIAIVHCSSWMRSASLQTANSIACRITLLSNSLRKLWWILTILLENFVGNSSRLTILVDWQFCRLTILLEYYVYEIWMPFYQVAHDWSFWEIFSQRECSKRVLYPFKKSCKSDT